MESLDDLREVMSCVVCLDTLSPLVVQCHRGHAVCKECKRDQQRCPSCRKPFLTDKPTLLCQIAAIVQGQCKFRGCSYIRQGRNDDHQTWCGFRPTNCKLCNWSGYGKDILNHVQGAHQAALIKGSENLVEKLEHSVRLRDVHVPFIALGMFFWLQIRVLNLDWQSQHNLLSLHVCLVPNGKIDYDVNFNVDFKSQDCEYDIRKKIELPMELPMEVPNMKNLVLLPALVLSSGVGMLKINIVKNGFPATCRGSDFYTKYNLNVIHDILVSLKNHFVEITAAEVILFIWVIMSCCSLLFYNRYIPN